MNTKILALFCCLTTILFGQFQPLKSYKIDNANLSSSNETPGLRTNSIGDIAAMGANTTWVGTGIGLSVLHDSTSIFSLDTMFIIDEDPRILNTVVSSMTAQNDILAFAGVTQMDGDPFGTGIYLTFDGLAKRIEWYRFDQPTEERADSLATFGNRYFKARTLSGTRGNVAYDMGISGDYLWIASWLGGLRRLNLTELDEWERIPLPLENQAELLTCDANNYDLVEDKYILKDYYWDSSDPEGNHNHKAFSVLVYGDTVWVGTANGINRGILGANSCMDWKHFFHPTDNISGNWVVSLAKQEVNGERIIWAVTRVIIPGGEQNTISFSRDDGITWEIVEELNGEICHDISASGSTVAVASNNGLWITEDGNTWNLLPPAVEATPVSFDEILNNQVVSVFIDDREYFSTPIIWIGTEDGLARSYNLAAENWQIFRIKHDENEIYAYPNPFSPLSDNQINNDGWVRFNTGSLDIGELDLKIFNFAMEEVYSNRFDWRNSPGAIKWNGRDKNGNLVANGVYFVNLQFSENNDSKQENHWIKLVVVK